MGGRQVCGPEQRPNTNVTVVSILTLALGIGVNTAFFAIAREVLLTELPARNPSELIELQCVSTKDVRPCQ